jgi:hypothetical protein
MLQLQSRSFKGILSTTIVIFSYPTFEDAIHFILECCLYNEAREELKLRLIFLHELKIEVLLFGNDTLRHIVYHNRHFFIPKIIVVNDLLNLSLNSYAAKNTICVLFLDKKRPKTIVIRIIVHEDKNSI